MIYSLCNIPGFVPLYVLFCIKEISLWRASFFRTLFKHTYCWVTVSSAGERKGPIATSCLTVVRWLPLEEGAMATAKLFMSMQIPATLWSSEIIPQVVYAKIFADVVECYEFSSGTWMYTGDIYLVFLKPPVKSVYPDVKWWPVSWLQYWGQNNGVGS